LVWLAAIGISPVQAQVSREYDLKAVLLYNLVQYTEWPPVVFSTPDSPLVIGVLGRDPFGKSLDEVVRGETNNQHRIVVERYQTVSMARNCHILFISTSEREKLPAILAELKGRPVLTVDDADKLAPRGGMVRLYTSQEGKIRLRVNLTTVKSAGLSLSSKLLRVAEIVEPEKN
jgi:hypothetical protein